MSNLIGANPTRGPTFWWCSPVAAGNPSKDWDQGHKHGQLIQVPLLPLKKSTKQAWPKVVNIIGQIQILIRPANRNCTYVHLYIYICCKNCGYFIHGIITIISTWQKLYLVNIFAAFIVKYYKEHGKECFFMLLSNFVWQIFFQLHLWKMLSYVFQVLRNKDYKHFYNSFPAMYLAVRLWQYVGMLLSSVCHVEFWMWF